MQYRGVFHAVFKKLYPSCIDGVSYQYVYKYTWGWLLSFYLVGQHCCFVYILYSPWYLRTVKCIRAIHHEIHAQIQKRYRRKTRQVQYIAKTRGDAHHDTTSRYTHMETSPIQVSIPVDIQAVEYKHRYMT